jgi:hypothetical protein
MHDHRPTDAGRTRVTWLDAGDARDQVRRALEANGIVLLNSDQGEGVMFVRAKIDSRKLP